MPWRHKYPEATSMRDHYRSVADSLDNHKSSIELYLNEAEITVNTDYESHGVAGSYYDTYCLKKDDWIEQHSKLIGTYNLFLDDLKDCIRRCRDLQTMWENRISIMEEYD